LVEKKYKEMKFRNDLKIGNLNIAYPINLFFNQINMSFIDSSFSFSLPITGDSNSEIFNFKKDKFLF